MEKIQIESFQAINADIEIKKMVLLIGEQASGKSTIAKLIYFFKSLKDEYIEFISKNLKNLNSIKELQELFWDQISRNFYRLFGSIQHFPYFKIQYFYSESKIITLDQGLWENSNRKKLKIEFSSTLFNDTIRNMIPLIHKLRKLRQDSAKDDAFGYGQYREVLEDFYRYINELFEDNNRYHVFIPAGRNITVNYANFFQQNFFGNLSSEIALIQDEEEKTTIPHFVKDTYLMMKFMQRVQILTDTFKGSDFEYLLADGSYPDYMKSVLDKIEEILKGKYKSDGRIGEIIVFNNEDYIQLENSSSGQQEVIRILQDIFLVLLNKRNVFRVIEEPEAHLFPMAQKYLLEIIAIMLNNMDNQMILTTHSPYILSVVNNLIFASISKSDSQYKLDPSETTVYSLTDRQSKSLIDPETGMIDQNALDTISEDLADEFEQMYRKYVAEKRISA